ncbi:MAG: hypothetical protein Kow0063_01420 [Anaerolineae bacterium]
MQRHQYILMLSLSTARKLKEAGLLWRPASHDFFAIPDRDFEDNVFVISDIFVNVELVRGRLAATFQGSVEWALDHVVIEELVWLPTEEQLRQELERRLIAVSGAGLKLSSTPGGYVCEFVVGEQAWRFEALDASEAYAAALLHLLAASP